MAEKENNKSFEQAVEELEKIANELETGNLGLEESVTIFENGMKLAKECNSLLENAEKRITVLLKDGEEDFVQKEE